MATPSAMPQPMPVAMRLALSSERHSTVRRSQPSAPERREAESSGSPGWNDIRPLNVSP
jgi:hypothetical protein